MPSFKDTKGREWPFTINISANARVKERHKIDLRRVLDDKMRLFHQILSDGFMLAEIVYTILKPDVSFEDFGDAIDGDTLYAMGEAFELAMIDFSPPPMRGPLKELRKKRQTYQETTSAWAVEKMGAMDAAETAVREAEARLKASEISTSDQPTSGPEFSASTPAR